MANTRQINDLFLAAADIEAETPITVGVAHAQDIDPVSVGSESIKQPRSSDERPALADSTEI